ncbi:MAG: four helix bundle protein [Ignavibacteriaceae bacterium]
MDKDLRERLFKFSVSTIKFLKKVRSSPELSVLKYQLTKSSTSCGANYEEAQAAASKADFKYKISISLKEIRESNYWLRILKELDITNNDDMDKLIDESGQLMKILGSISSKLSKNVNL